MRHVCIVTWITSSLFMGPAEAQDHRPPIQADVSQSAADSLNLRSNYVLGPDDQIFIEAVDVPDISGRPQRLDPNGDLKLPMVGRIHAAGLTLQAFEAELMRRLKTYLEDPDVAVTITEFRSEPVSVLGAVNKSGVHQLEGRKTLIEMLSLAGGISVDAGPSIRLTRRLERGPIPLTGATEDGTGAFTIAEIDLKSLLEATHPELNIIIEPYDVISVPRAELVYVVGEVAKVGPVRLTAGHSMSVLEALSTSGGMLRNAAPGGARIFRQVAGDQMRTEIPLDLTKVMQGRAVDQQLLPGDILIVPDSRRKRAAARMFEAALQAGVLIGSYGVVH
jgi:polysaccharide export outer membrane protein